MTIDDVLARCKVFMDATQDIVDTRNRVFNLMYQMVSEKNLTTPQACMYNSQFEDIFTEEEDDYDG